MAQAASVLGPAPRPLTVASYFELVTQGVLRPDDRVELLEGVIVAMSPQNPPHAAAVNLAGEALRRAIGEQAALRIQSPLLLAPHSVPEPDVAVVPGRTVDYFRAHPTTALLVVEIADSSLVQDRLTKATIYASAGIPEYWIVNLRDDCVEVYREPDRATGTYASRRIASRGEQLDFVSFPATSVTVNDLIPPRD